jgi:HSP20 family protein
MAQHPISRRDQGRIDEDPRQRDLGSIVGRLMGGFFAPYERGASAPRFWDLDVSGNEQEIVVRAEVPGFDEKEIDVRIDRDMLTIRAEQEKKGDGREEYRTYFETVALPPGTNPDGARATYHNGVLELHVPRAEEARAKRVMIEGRQSEPSAQGRQPSSKKAETSTGQSNNRGQQPSEGSSEHSTAKSGK